MSILIFVVILILALACWLIQSGSNGRCKRSRSCRPSS